MTTVRDVMTTDLVTVAPTATVAEAATVMGSRNVGSAVVVEDGVPTGIFTERDILHALGAHFDAARYAVAQLMTRDPTTIPADATIEEARDLMLERGFRHLLVSDGNDVIGIVSIRDLVQAAQN